MTSAVRTVAGIMRRKGGRRKSVQHDKPRLGVKPLVPYVIVIVEKVACCTYLTMFVVYKIGTIAKLSAVELDSDPLMTKNVDTDKDEAGSAHNMEVCVNFATATPYII